MKKSFRLLSLLLTLCILITGACFTGAAAVADGESMADDAYTVTSGIQDNVQDGVILHAFCWSYDTIRENLSAIAQAGYTAVQTSPVQQPKNYGNWDDVTGQYWKLYQPLSYSIGTESWLGTKEDLTRLCTEAHKYGIKIICDVVLNHLANDSNGTMGTLYEGLKDTLPEIYQDYKDNYNPTNADKLTYLHFCTRTSNDSNLQSLVQGYVNNLISVNTGSKQIQDLAAGLLKECVDCGVDGFRFDAAKHIETPDDGDYASDFWPNVLGDASAYASETQNGKELYYYGEVLNSVGAGRQVSSYTKFMSLTDNNESDTVTNYVYRNNAQSVCNLMTNNGGYRLNAGAENTVLWAESHDTYLGTSGSGGVGCTKVIPDEDIMKAWAMNASRKDATALYFARPGVLMKKTGDTSWKSTAVSEVNKFHNLFTGESEQIGCSGDFVYNQRGDSGIVIVNCNGMDASVDISNLSMADGEYIDTVTGNVFTVSGGNIKGNIGSTGIAVVYRGEVTPKITVSQEGASFKGDTYTLTITVENADSASYTIGGGDATAFTGEAEVTIGEGFEYGAKIPVTVSAVKGDKTTSVTYYYEKLQPANTGVYVFYDNSKTQYDQVYCYTFDRYDNNDSYSINNANWPGEKMDYDPESGLYYYEVPDVKGTVTVPDGEVNLDLLNDEASGVIFSNGVGNQYPSQSSKTVLRLGGKSHLLTCTNTWGEVDLKVGDPYGILGECTGDDKINVSDATCIQKYAAQKKNIVSVASKNADVNGDGAIDVNDATLIQKYCAGMNTGYKIGESRGATVEVPATAAPTLPQAEEGSSVFYVVAASVGNSSIFADGCKMWIYNVDTGEAVETVKQDAESDAQVKYAYAVIPDSWTNLKFYRTNWTATELDVNDSSTYISVFTPYSARSAPELNAVVISNSSSAKFRFSTFNPLA